MPQFTNRVGRTLASATLLAAFLATVPLHDGRAQQSPVQPSATQPAPGKATRAKHSADRSAERDQGAAREARHPPPPRPADKVAQTMKANGDAIRASMTDRSTRLKTMTAVDDLKSYQAVAD